MYSVVFFMFTFKTHPLTKKYKTEKQKIYDFLVKLSLKITAWWEKDRIFKST